MTAESLITILIPAYNNTETLIHALDSIAKQTIASNISVIVSDDCSPKQIDPLLALQYEDTFHGIRFFRQKVNLGVVSNKTWLFNQVATKYFSFMEHDDWHLKNDMYSTAISYLEENIDVGCFFGNTFVEPWWMSTKYNHLCEIIPTPLDSHYMYNLNKLYSGDVKRTIIDGVDWTNKLTNSYSNESSPFNTSWSALVINTGHMRALGGFGAAYRISKSEAYSLNIYWQEEHFCCLYLLASRFKFQLEMEPSIVRGYQPTAYSKSLSHPARKMDQDGAFYAFYKLAWILSKQYHNEEVGYIIRELYRRCHLIGLTHETEATNNFLEVYLPSVKEHREMAVYMLERSRKI